MTVRQMAWGGLFGVIAMLIIGLFAWWFLSGDPTPPPPAPTVMQTTGPETGWSLGLYLLPIAAIVGGGLALAYNKPLAGTLIAAGSLGIVLLLVMNDTGATEQLTGENRYFSDQRIEERQQTRVHQVPRAITVPAVMQRGIALPGAQSALRIDIGGRDYCTSAGVTVVEHDDPDITGDAYLSITAPGHEAVPFTYYVGTRAEILAAQPACAAVL